jgi:tetratricopeptide (TPR) repeat protein
MRSGIIGLALVLGGAALPVLAQEKPAAPVVNPNLPKDTQAAQLQLKAEGLLNQGKFGEAAKLLRQAATLTPEDWVLWDQAGWAHLDALELDPALQAFEEARKAAPPGSPVGGLLIARFAKGDVKAVQELLTRDYPADLAGPAGEIVAKGLAAKEGSPDWSYALGHLFARVLRNSRRALAPLEATARAQATRPEVWLLLTEVNQELGRGPQEDAAAVEYLKLAPETVDAYRIRAGRAAAEEAWQDAVTEYEAGITKHPAAPELYYGLARLHERLKRMPQAEATYNKLIATATTRKLPDLQQQGRSQLAAFHTRRGKYPEALRFYQEAALRPDATPATWNTWGSLLALTGKWAEAAGAWESAADREEKALGKGARLDELFATRYHAAVARVAAGARDQAKTKLEAALGEKPARTAPQMEAAAFLVWLTGSTAPLGPVEYQRSDERWAAFAWRREVPEDEVAVSGGGSTAQTAWRAVLREVLGRQVDCWPAAYAVARLSASAGDTTGALNLLSKTADLRGDWWAPHYTLGQYYAVRRDKDKGVPALRRALQFAPECRQARAYLSLLSNVKDEVETPEQP